MKLPQDTAVTSTEARKRLGVSQTRIQQLVDAGRLTVVFEEPFPGGKRYWLSKADVEREARQRRTA